MSKKITIRGRQYNLSDIGDLASIQSVLVPDNWVLKKSEGVNLFLSMQNMLALQLKRHVAANWKTMVKTALEEGEDGNKAQVSAGFSFTIDLTAPQVATISAHKLAFSVKHETKGKPQTHDLNQGEFLDDDMNVVLDIGSFAKESEEAAQAAHEEKDARKAEATADPTAGADVTPENTPGDAVAPKKRGRPKKVQPAATA